MVAGAILILAAAASLAGALLANALCTAAGRTASPGWPGYVACLVASVIGFLLLAAGTLDRTRQSRSPFGNQGQDSGPAD